MSRFLSKISTINHIFSITLILFLIINIFIAVTWPIYIKNKYKDFKPYNDEVLKALNLSEKDGLTLYLETWVKTGFEFSRFLEIKERSTLGKNHKFVNVSKEFGRKINNPNVCNKNFFFYGGSTTFGYNVTDNQTIPYYFKTLLNEKFKDNQSCVYNLGSASYHSTQETIQFHQDLVANKIKKNDYVFFLDGINEYCNRNTRATNFLSEKYNESHVKQWNKYKYASKSWFKSLPFMQLLSRLKQKYVYSRSDDILPTGNKCTLPNLKDVYQTNIDIRNSICRELTLTCANFLQPFAGLHGKYFDQEQLKDVAPENAIITSEESKFLEEKYLILSSAKNIFDISNALDSHQELSYVDGVHYSPSANKMIAEKMFELILKK